MVIWVDCAARWNASPKMKHLVGLRHIHLFSKYERVVPVRDTQQHTVVIWLHVPHFQIACRRHQRSVVIVHRITQHVVVAVNLSAGLQKFHLIGKAPLCKHANSLFVGGFTTTERHIEGYNLLHTFVDALHVTLSQRFAPFLLEVAIVSARDGVLDEEFGTREDIAGSLVKHKTKRAHIDAMARSLDLLR